MMKRTLFATLCAITLAAAMATASAATIGLMAPLSGPQALVGQDQVDGFLLGLEQHGGKLGGQPVTVVKEDDQLKPEVGQWLRLSGQRSGRRSAHSRAKAWPRS